MILLALETATDACSAALLVHDQLRERFQLAPRGHTALILPMIDELLVEAGIGLSQVDALAFGRGPGAFTGVRIAVGVAQGIAFGADLPVVPVSTLAALAQGCEADRVLTALDARMDEVYWAAYERNKVGLMTLRGEECVVPPRQAPLPAAGDWYGVGSGWASYRDALRQQAAGRVTGCNEHGLPHARDVARLGAAAYQQGQAVSADQALPVYLRDTVAWQKSR
jgi:tRNA threonylcarbamoyladenosine biosynthesis protein TsaB